jgi:hypothetical protein
MTKAKMPDLEPDGGDTEDVDVDDAQISDDQDGELTNSESNLDDAEQRRL